MIAFSSLSRNSLLGRFLRWPLNLIPDDAEVPILQGRMRGMRWIVGSSNHGCWLGSYEAAKQRAFVELARGRSVVYDVGANVGFYTLLGSAVVAPAGRVFAFEPVSRNLKYLRRHLEINRVANVTVIDAAVSDGSGHRSFAHGASNATGHLSPNGDSLVRVETLDRLIELGTIQDPDVIKIDIEGGELGALRGAKRMLERARPTMLLATHGDSIHRECIGFLRDLDYRVMHDSPDGIELPPDELIAFG